MKGKCLVLVVVHSRSLDSQFRAVLSVRLKRLVAGMFTLDYSTMK